MRRWLWWLLLGAAVVGIVLVASFWWQWLIIHLSQETGTSDSNSRAYAYWSGFGSVFPWSLAILGGILAAVKHANCHTPGCWHLGHVTPAGYKLCKTCAPKSKAELGLHEIHPDHVA